MTQHAQPVVTRHGVLDMQVCVPVSWTDEQVIDFVKRQSLCDSAPAIRRAGDRMLGGAPERNPCSDREGFVHIVVDY